MPEPAVFIRSGPGAITARTPSASSSAATAARSPLASRPPATFKNPLASEGSLDVVRRVSSRPSAAAFSRTCGTRDAANHLRMTDSFFALRWTPSRGS
eukprot:scaffold34117_cov51-Phaeocystis_antarctica.AAC.1